jgi:short-subunit dehydrogenase
MNFSVIRSADTYWGGVFATELAKHKRHLLLVGKNLTAIELLSQEIRKSFRVTIHCFQLDDSDTDQIIKFCEMVNANFEVDFLLNYSQVRWTGNLVQSSIFELSKALKTSYLASPVFTHQFLPNLVLHANSCVLELGCGSDRIVPFQESVRTFNTSFSNCLRSEIMDSEYDVRVCQAELPWIDEIFFDGSLAGPLIAGLAEKVLSTSFPEHFFVDELFVV